MSQQAMVRVLTIKGAATYLSRTPKAIMRLREKGQIKALKLGRRVGFEVKELDQYVERMKAKTRLIESLISDNFEV